MSEIKILQDVEHENIVKLNDVFITDDKVCLVMEFMLGGELFDRIVSKEVYNEGEARLAVKDITTAIDYCHDKNIVHRLVQLVHYILKIQAND